MAAGRIALTKGLFALVSPEDEHLSSRKWHAYKGKSGFYALGKVGIGGKKQKTISLHRTIVGMMPNGAVVDHINGDTLDCRRENLRITNRTVNNRNRVGAQKNSTTGILGVYPRGRRYGAMIRNGGKQIHLGTFLSLEEAAEARASAEINLWGVEPRRSMALKGEY